MKKIMDEETDCFNVLSTEDMLLSNIDQISIENEIESINNMINSSKESVFNLNKSIEIAKIALESDNILARDVVNLNNAISATSMVVGLPVMDNFSIEDISDPKESLKISIEKGQNVVMTVINGINKTFARFNNVIIKYIGKFDTLLSSMATNLSSRKGELEQLNKEGKKLTDATIADDTFFGWNGLAMLGAVGIGKMNDPVEGLNEMIKVYGKPNFVKEMTDNVLSLVRADKALKPIYKNTEAMRAIERNLGKKIKNFFCKSTVDDRLILGATNKDVYILERCKKFHLTSSIFPWDYSIIMSSLPPFDAYGAPKSFNTPKYNDLIKLIDDGIKVTANQKKVVNDIHDILKIGSETIADIDDSANWENSNIYGILPQVLLVLSKTYAEIPNMVDGLASIYIKELKSK